MRTFIITFLLLSAFSSSVLSSQSTPLENKLKQHASPYLAMHGNDPVAWQEWNQETVSRAQKQGKLLFVSSGYFSCHWCHVMQRESYQNKRVANILNTYFIPVKVDRELAGALDTRLIDFVERTQGRAGWPLNVFITPDGYPLVGMTYVPTKNFTEILNNLKIKWKEEKALLEKIARETTEELATVSIEGSENIQRGLGKDYLSRFLLQSTTMADDMAGGFGEQNKFPSYPQLTVMLQAYKNNGDKGLKQFLDLTLEKMASQGLYDQLGGGFFRYVVDPAWQVPHFEKMLYDNALLSALYINAAKILQNKKFEAVAKNTLDFMLNVLRSPQGAYIASLSAIDDKGVEGGYYLWQADELKKQLSKDEMRVIELVWQLEGAADLEDGHHLVEVMDSSEAAKMLKLSVTRTKRLFISAKQKMLKLRIKRNLPQDNKLLAGWNGLALSAFSKAAQQFDNKHYAKAAKEIKNYIYQNLWKNKALVRAVKKGKVIGRGELEDYAYVAQGLYDWLEYSNNKEDEEWLKLLVAQSWKRFYSKNGWILAEDMLLKYGQGDAIVADGVLPSPSAILINTSIKYAVKTNNAALKKKALEALNIGHLELVSQPFWYASQIFALFAYQEGN